MERTQDSAAPPTLPTAVVSGANRGIGKAVAAELIERGWRVILLARDPAKGEAVRAELTELTEPGGAEPVLVPGDLSSARTTRQAAETLLAGCPRIDALVHNAAIWPSRRDLNEDGLEQAFFTNHLAPFLLNHLLEDRLVASGARVVQVSAGLYVKGRTDPDRTPTGADFHALRTYADTKLCNLLLVPRFAERWHDAGVTINALHPGVIRTGLGDRGGPVGLLLKAAKRMWKDPRTGARPVVRLVVAPELADVTGRYFEIDKEAALVPPADDPELARALWEQALRLGELTERPRPVRPRVG